MVGYAQPVNPKIDIVARTYATGEALYMHRRGVSEVVMAEHELALEMTRHTLPRYGLSGLEIQALLNRLRARLTDERDAL